MKSTDVRRVALLGFGTVGRAVARILCRRGASLAIELAVVCTRGAGRRKVDWVPSGVVWTDCFDEVLQADIDTVVELIGGLEPAESWIRRSLEAGKSVVTANKQVIARDGPALVELAGRSKGELRFEAAVGGVVPVIHGLQEALAGDRLLRIAGVLNGTCNYILSRMGEGAVRFSDALREAQRLGFAEADPSADVDGFDARAKLAILATIAFGYRIQPHAIPCRSITGVDHTDFVLARRLGTTVRQVAWAERHRDDPTCRVTAGVQPALVPTASPFGRLDGSDNLVSIVGEWAGEVTLSGRGAGAEPTAIAVVSDLLAIARGGPAARRSLAQAVEPGRVEGDYVARHYVRVGPLDGEDVQPLADRLVSLLGRHGIPARVLAPQGAEESAPPAVALVTAACRRKGLEEALNHAAGTDTALAGTVWLPVFDGKPLTAPFERN